MLDCPSCTQDRAILCLHTHAMQVVILYLFSTCLIIMMLVCNQPVRTLCKVSFKPRTGRFSSTAGWQADDIRCPSSSSLIALHPLLLLKAILLKRPDKASEKCTNWFQVVSSGTRSKTVAVGEHTSTSEQFSCQVQKGSGLSHYINSLMCSHQGDLVREQKLNTTDGEVMNSFVHPSSSQIVTSPQPRSGEVCMTSAHREDNSRAEPGRAQVMLMGNKKHFEGSTAMMHSPFSQ